MTLWSHSHIGNMLADDAMTTDTNPKPRLCRVPLTWSSPPRSLLPARTCVSKMRCSARSRCDGSARSTVRAEFVAIVDGRGSLSGSGGPEPHTSHTPTTCCTRGHFYQGSSMSPNIAAPALFLQRRKSEVRGSTMRCVHARAPAHGARHQAARHPLLGTKRK